MMFQIRDTLSKTVKAFPQIPNLLLDHYGYESFYAVGEYRTFLQEFAQIGVLNAIPVARFGSNSVGIRLSPGINQNQIGCVVFGNHSEAITLTMNLSLLGPSLLCYQGFIECLYDFGEADFLNRLQRDGSVQGLEPPFSSFLSLALQTKFSSDYYQRRSELWRLLGSLYEDEFIKFLGDAWMQGFNVQEVGTSLEQSSAAPWINCRRLFTPWTNSGNELQQIVLAKEILLSDDIFDATYSALGAANSPGNIRSRPLFMASGWICENSGSIDFELDDSEMALAKAIHEGQEEYDGALHLAIAEKLQATSPSDAFTHFCNASAFWSRINGELNLEIFTKLQVLCKNNSWDHLVAYYRWLEQSL